LLFQPTELDRYIKNKFINFYSHACTEKKNDSGWEMELELDKEMNKLLKKCIM
jgi:hypothetical protein